MTARVLAAFIISILCLSLVASRLRVPEKLTLVAAAADGVQKSMDPYCDGKTVLFFNSGTTSTQAKLPTSEIGLQCRMLSSTAAIITMLPQTGETIYSLSGDGSDENVIYISTAANGPGANVSLSGMGGGKWTVRKIYGTWTEVP